VSIKSPDATILELAPMKRIILLNADSVLINKFAGLSFCCYFF
jgi:hypothetical protein